MTPSEALEAIITLAGGSPIATRNPASTAFRFTSAVEADRVKAVLDALLPAGSTGAVYGSGLLVVSMAAAGDHTETAASTGPVVRRFLDLSTHHPVSYTHLTLPTIYSV